MNDGSNGDFIRFSEAVQDSDTDQEVITDVDYTLRGMSRSVCKRFRTLLYHFRIQWHPRDIDIEATFNRLANQLVQGLGPNHSVRAVILEDNLEIPISVSYMRPGDFTGEALLRKIEKISQSKKSFNLNGARLEFYVTYLPSGRGKRLHLEGIVGNFAKNKRAIFSCRGADLCLPKVLALSVLRQTDIVKYRRLYDSSAQQYKEAIKLCNKAKVRDFDFGLAHIENFESCMGYQLIVWGGSIARPSIFYRGKASDKQIHLFLTGNHYFGISTITGFLKSKHFCKICLKPYWDTHPCLSFCSFCRRHQECIIDTPITCNDCGFQFPNHDCFSAHKLSKRNAVGKRYDPRCVTHKFCQACKQTFTIDHTHVCFERKCLICKAWVEPDHLCFMQPTGTEGAMFNTDEFPSLDMAAERKLAPQTVTIYFDVESKFVNNEHIPNLIVAQRACGLCEDRIFDKHSVCDVCGKNQHVFYTMKGFVNWLLTTKTHKNSNVFSHNGRAYDMVLLSKALFDAGCVPEVIHSGAKIMCLVLKEYKIRFIDSLNFVTTRLAAFPKMFSLKEQSKGYFPYQKNDDAHQDYIGPMFPIEAYSPEQMTESGRAEFLLWYEEHKNDTFDLQADLLSYCESDVTILRLGMVAFRKAFIADNQYDPFRVNFTISSAVNGVFRQSHLQPKTIGIIPIYSYSRNTASRSCRQWLKYLMESQNIHIDCEVRVGIYIVDGFCKETNTVYEFNGEFYHCRPETYPVRHQIHPVFNVPVEDIYNKWLTKLNYLKTRFNVICMWENDFRSNVTIQSIVRTYDLLPPIHVSDAMTGGRTEVFWLYKKIEEGERLKYVDFTSLYPAVMREGPYPIGHPEVIRGNFGDIKSYYGLFKIKIAAPRNLWLPVLGQKFEKKLFFASCRTCLESYHQGECHHLDDERAFTGVWTTPELDLALSLGYIVIAIYEIWDYKQKSTSLFKGIVNTFLRQKIEASGWPAHVKTDQDKREFVEAYKQFDQITLRPEHIEQNLPKRVVAKQCVNCIWGYFALTPKPTSKYLTEPEDFFKLLRDPTISVKSVFIINSDMLFVRYKQAETAPPPSNPKTSLLHAVFTTALARVKLYKTLMQLSPRQVVYVDTDSVVYSVKPGQPSLSTGTHVGELTNELEKYGTDAYISEFVATAPKSYSMKVFDPDTGKTFYDTRVKGVTLNYQNKQLINFDAMKDMVLNRGPSIATHNPTKITRNINTGQIFNVAQTKQFSFNHDKRVSRNDFSTLPYGY